MYLCISFYILIINYIVNKKWAVALNKIYIFVGTDVHICPKNGSM